VLLIDRRREVGIGRVVVKREHLNMRRRDDSGLANDRLD